jgi:hypothetical protein
MSLSGAGAEELRVRALQTVWRMLRAPSPPSLRLAHAGRTQARGSHSAREQVRRASPGF